ncbi:MAG: hypothetical protein ACI4IF_05445 [Acutalibacteraceae bacterium]
MKNLKNITFKDIKESPVFTAVLLFLIVAVVIAAAVYLSLGINKTKAQIVEARKSYEQNVKEMAILEELRAQSEKAQELLESYKGILPDELGDIYVLQESVQKECETFGMTVSEMAVEQAPFETYETKFHISATCTFRQLYDYMVYQTTSRQIKRIDDLTFVKNPDNTYTVTFSYVILSQNGASGLIVDAEAEAETQA